MRFLSTLKLEKLDLWNDIYTFFLCLRVIKAFLKAHRVLDVCKPVPEFLILTCSMGSCSLKHAS